MAKKISESIWEDVVQAYIDTGSILDTAAKCKVSTVKVRKILITEGLWSSKTSEQIDELLKNGFNSAQVAEKEVYMTKIDLLMLLDLVDIETG